MQLVQLIHFYKKKNAYLPYREDKHFCHVTLFYCFCLGRQVLSLYFVSVSFGHL